MATLLTNDNWRGRFGTAFLAVVALVAFTPEAKADSGFYLGGSIGQAAIEVDVGDAIQPLVFDEDDFGWKALLGYNFKFTVLELGLEASYVNLGGPSANVLAQQVEIETTGLSGFGVVGVALGPIGVFGKYGVMSWDAEGTVDGLPAFDEDGSDPAYGIGAKFGIGSLDLRLEYELFDIDDAEDVSMISVGLVWTF